MIVAVIPARQWSVGCPGKNRDGFQATLEVAQACADRVVVTTDDPLLWDGAYETVRRPPELEDGPTGPVVAHALEAVSCELVLVLQPSSPTTQRVEYCRAALRLLQRDASVSSVVSVVPWVGEPPQKAVYVRRGELVIDSNARRQDCERAYRRDGTLYAVRAWCAAKGDLYGPRPVPLLVTPRHSVTVD